MTLLRSFFLLVLLGLFSPSLAAQDYGSAIGLRLGFPFSVSYKNFLNRTDALEIYAGVRNFDSYGWFSVNAAYQRHTDIAEVYGLQWYYGGGAGLQFWNYDATSEGSVTLAISGYLGLQYSFYDLPLTFSLDWRPSVFIGKNLGTGFNTFGAGYGGLGVRYILFR